MRCNYAVDAWYFRQGAEFHGPVTAKQLATLVAKRCLDARQIVWARRDHGLLFVRAEAVVRPKHHVLTAPTAQSVQLRI